MYRNRRFNNNLKLKNKITELETRLKSDFKKIRVREVIQKAKRSRYN